MADADDFDNQSSSRHPGTTDIPQPHTNVPSMRVMQLQQARPSFTRDNCSPQGEYAAYYTGPSRMSYSYSYGSSTDASGYGSPTMQSTNPSAAGTYSGMAPRAAHAVSSVMRPATGVLYDFSSPHLISQFYCSAQSLLHYAVIPHSPMQSAAVSPMLPATPGHEARPG